MLNLSMKERGFGLLMLISGSSLGYLFNLKQNRISKVLGIVSAIILVCWLISYFFKRDIRLKPVAIVISFVISVLQIIGYQKLLLLEGKGLLISWLALLILTVLQTLLLETLLNWWLNLNLEEKLFIVIGVIMSIIMIFLLDSNKSIWYEGYDHLYSMDSFYVANKMVLSPAYLDIRHPGFTVLMLPFTTVISVLFKSFLYSPLRIALLIQSFNSLFLMSGAVLISQIFEKKALKYVYVLSYPVLLNIFILEKTSFSNLLVIMTVYLIVKNKNSLLTIFMGVISSFSYLTSSLIMVPFILLSENIMTAIKRGLQTGIFALLSYFMIGRLEILVNFRKILAETTGSFSNHEATIGERIHAGINMIGSALVPVISEIPTKKGGTTWDPAVVLSFNLFTTLILVILIVGAFSKNTPAKFISIFWVFFGFLLISVGKWAIFESPLFTYYFSWAIVALVYLGFESIAKKLVGDNYYFVLLAVFGTMVLFNFWRLNGLIDLVSKL